MGFSREYGAKPIPAKYNNIEFRSRLEARWAVYFDQMHIEYLYEYEGFQLHCGWYLPDFYLPTVGMWAEVKPDIFTLDEIIKCRALVEMTKKTVLMLSGPPKITNYWSVSTYSTEYEELIYVDYIVNDSYLCENRFYSCTGWSRFPYQDDGSKSKHDRYDEWENAVNYANKYKFY